MMQKIIKKKKISKKTKYLNKLKYWRNENKDKKKG